jgi:hypothetical protein
MASGRDASANLSGMLGQIGKAVGGMGDAYKPINEALMKKPAPDYDPQDPESIKRYQRYLISQGEHGVASQLNYVLEKAMDTQAKKKVGSLAASDQKLANIEQGITANANNPQASQALNQALAQAQQERARLDESIANDPRAATILQKQTDEATTRELNQLRLEREQASAAATAAQKQEQGISNAIASSVLSGQIDLEAYATDPEAFLESHPAIAIAVEKHPEAFEDAIARVEDVRQTNADLAQNALDEKEYTAAELKDLGLPENFNNAYRSQVAQFGRKAANEFVRVQVGKVQAENIKEGTKSVAPVYNTATIPMYKRTVEGDLAALTLSSGQIEENNFLENLFNQEEDIVYPAEVRELQQLLKDKDTRAAVTNTVVTNMQADKADPSDEAVRMQYVSAALRRIVGYDPNAEAEAEAPETPTETDARGRRKKRELPTITTREQFDALEVGAEFYNADGSLARK